VNPRDALEAIAALQPARLDKLRAAGVVFDDIGRDPGNWQHVAFSLYTDLCEVDSYARAGLAELDGNDDDD